MNQHRLHSVTWCSMWGQCKLVGTSLFNKKGRIISLITAQTKETNQNAKMKNEVNVMLYLHFLYCFSCGGVRLASVELRSLVGAQLIPKWEDEYICSTGVMIIDTETEGSRTVCPSSTLFTKNSTKTVLGLNSGLRIEKPANNCLWRYMALCNLRAVRESHTDNNPVRPTCSARSVTNTIVAH
jgi:hypothetical protein